MKRAVLAYSGGLDTSVAIHWLADQGYEVHAVAVDVGQREDFDADRRPAAARPAPPSVRVVDATDRFAAEYLTRAIKTNALYEGKYPMVSGLARPCIVEEVVARRPRGRGADVVAHGCTGKGNDQVRFEVTFGVLGARPRGPGADPRCEHPARQGDRARGGVGDPDREHREQLLDRREPVGADGGVRRRWRTPGWRRPRTPSTGRPPPPTGRPSRPRSSSRSTAACRSRSTARPCRCRR